MAAKNRELSHIHGLAGTAQQMKAGLPDIFKFEKPTVVDIPPAIAHTQGQTGRASMSSSIFDTSRINVSPPKVELTVAAQETSLTTISNLSKLPGILNERWNHIAAISKVSRERAISTLTNNYLSSSLNTTASQKSLTVRNLKTSRLAQIAERHGDPTASGIQERYQIITTPLIPKIGGSLAKIEHNGYLNTKSTTPPPALAFVSGKSNNANGFDKRTLTPALSLKSMLPGKVTFDQSLPGINSAQHLSVTSLDLGARNQAALQIQNEGHHRASSGPNSFDDWEQISPETQAASQGQNSVQINMNRSLIEQFTISTNHVEEGIESVKQKVEEALLEILNSINPSY